jgi:hypothetical protein
MIKRTLMGVLLCSILLCGCAGRAANDDAVTSEISSGTEREEVNSDQEKEVVNTDQDNKEPDTDKEKEATAPEAEAENKASATADNSQQTPVDYSSVIPMSISNPEEYDRLMGEIHTLTEKLTTLNTQTVEFRETNWAINDLKEQAYGDIAGKLVGSDITMEDFGGSMMEYYYASSQTFADDLIHGEEFSPDLKEGDTLMVFGNLPFRIERVYCDDKFDPNKVTGYQLSYERNFEKRLETNLAGILGKYTSTGFEFNGEKYDVVWHEGREKVKTNLDSIIDGAYSLNSSHRSLGEDVPTIYRRISVTDYVELANLQVGQNWYFGDWTVDQNSDKLYEITEPDGLFNIDDITTGHCTIMMDSEDRYLDHAVLDISWMDMQGNTITYVYHLDAGWNAYKLGSYPQAVKFNYGS